MTDKITHHGYHRFYEKVIDKNSTKMLEIGIERKHSLNLWLSYLPNCYVYGIDINIELTGDRYCIFKYDQSNIDHLSQLKMKIGDAQLDFILDDGSHVPEHQILSFNTLFSLVKDGGIYIIEDIETSYWKNALLYKHTINCGHTSNMNLINIFSNVLHLLNKEFLKKNNQTELENKTLIPIAVIDQISSITFGQNCIIIRKKEQYEYEYNNRTYRFAKKI